MQYPLDILYRHRDAGVLLDTNLALLMFIGKFNLDLIEQLPRVREYSARDYLLLEQILSFFETRLTTPNILTEVVNLIDKEFHSAFKVGCYTYVADGLKALVEIYNESKHVSSMSEFFSFGLTDAGIIETSNQNCLLVTNDEDLFGDLQSKGRGVIYFKHLLSMRDQLHF